MTNSSVKVTFFLRALEEFYALAVGFRNWLYDNQWLKIHHSRLPVISIGNLTVGGNAKTPLCIWLCRQLKELGFRPVVLTRGYGSRVKGVQLVNTTDSPDQVGDEPLLICRLAVAAVVVSPDRVKGVQFIEQNSIGDVVVLDDGFQHRRLFRQVDIVSVNVSTLAAIDAFIAGRLMPAGRFREHRDRGLLRAGVVVFSERKLLNSEMPLDNRLLRLMPPKVKVFRSQLKVFGIVKLEKCFQDVNLWREEDSLTAPQKIVAFSAIANPEGFQQTLENLNFQLAAKIEFPDHHKIQSHEIEKIVSLHPGTPIVCTMKDAVKLNPQGDVPIYVLCVDTVLESGEMFMQLIRSKLNDDLRRGARSA